MEIAIKLSQFLLSLSFLVILHELGHFIPAKLFKTRVEKFYLFFDFKFSLFKKKVGETEYGVGWIPLGGYVKIAGMIDESMDKEQMAQPVKPWEFRAKPSWQRLIIMLGGVTMNFILAFVIYIGMAFAYGEAYIANEDLKDGLLFENKVMNDVGFVTGDRIVSIDGEKIVKLNNELYEKIILAKEVVVNRAGVEHTIVFPIDFVHRLENYSKEFKSGERIPLFSKRIPFAIDNIDNKSANVHTLKPKDIIVGLEGKRVKYLDEVKTILEANKGKTLYAVVIRKDKEQVVQVNVSNEGKLGVIIGELDERLMEKYGYYKLHKQEFGFFECFPRGIEMGYNKVASYGKQLKMISNPDTGAYKQVGGFGAIYKIFPAEWSWSVFWNITAILSIMLGVMNLLPIPALDGGHVMFLLFEMVSGKKPSDKFMENAQIVGFVLLISLLVFANGNDIYKAIFSK